MKHLIAIACVAILSSCCSVDNAKSPDSIKTNETMEKERLEEAVSIMQARVIGLSSTEPIIRPKPESVDENHPKREEMQNYLGDQ